MYQSGAVIIPDGMKPQPEKHEVEIAWILARHYRCIVEFLIPTAGYKMKTADIVMNGVMWEIKSPTGRTRRTINNQFVGRKQSRNLIIDGRRTKLSDDHIQQKIGEEMTKRNRIDRVLFITTCGNVVEVR